MNNKVRKDFPILKQSVQGNALIYFDNAATSQKPQAVIDSQTIFYKKYNNNIHRSIYASGEKTTQLYEKARTTVAAFINAQPEEVVFTKGTTEGINFIASTWAADIITAGDEIVITQMEHHSNLLPWQQLARAKNALLKYIPVMENGTLNLENLSGTITKKTKLVAVTHISNALGTVNDIELIINQAHKVGAHVLIDAAQSAPHQKIDVKNLNADFLVFSGHKMLAPTGIGVLFIKKELHDHVRPYQYGGGMVYEVDFFDARWQKAPHKFEAGTPSISQAIGLGAAINYLDEYIDFNMLKKHEAALCEQLIDGLAQFERIKILGPIDQLKKQGHLVSFIVDGIHAHDVAAHLSNYNMCVRAGHHCAQPLAKLLTIEASVRASFYIYNTHKEVEKFLKLIRLLLVK